MNSMQNLMALNILTSISSTIVDSVKLISKQICSKRILMSTDFRRITPPC